MPPEVRKFDECETPEEAGRQSVVASLLQLVLALAVASAGHTVEVAAPVGSRMTCQNGKQADRRLCCQYLTTYLMGRSAGHTLTQAQVDGSNLVPARHETPEHEHWHVVGLSVPLHTTPAQLQPHCPGRTAPP
jgi:hypothetical protein